MFWIWLKAIYFFSSNSFRHLKVSVKDLSLRRKVGKVDVCKPLLLSLRRCFLQSTLRMKVLILFFKFYKKSREESWECRRNQPMFLFYLEIVSPLKRGRIFCLHQVLKKNESRKLGIDFYFRSRNIFSTQM